MTSIIKVDQIQTAAGGVPTAADLGLNVSGTVLQVKSTSISTMLTTTSTSFTGITGLAVTLTPSDANNRLLVIVMLANESYGGSYSDRGVDYAIYQDGSQIYRAEYDLYNSSSSAQRIYKSTPMVEIPAGTTNATTINMNYRSSYTGATARINGYGAPSVMTVMEIAG